MKIENWSHKRSHKLDEIGVERIRTFPFVPILFTTLSVAYDPVKTTLLELEAEAEEQTNHKAQNQIL